jgi:two-component system, chemotaxis family, protein-glutamate methylesterase/glutaminase
LCRTRPNAKPMNCPKAAIANVTVDHILSLKEIAAALKQLVRRPVKKAPAVPEDIMEEVKVSNHAIPDLDHMQKIGDLTPYSCPECGGSLWKARKEPLTRYVCHTGHSFSQESYLTGQAEVIENSLWSAIRYVQERIDVLQKMTRTYRDKAQHPFADDLEQKIGEMKHHVLVLRKFIMSGVLKEINETAET